MALATSLLSLEQIQLLADCIEPVVVPEIPAAAQALMHRGLLVSSKVNSDQLSCYFLAVTGRGRSYVTAWVERQERPKRHPVGKLIKFPAIGSS
jgi:hypothetical protein